MAVTAKYYAACFTAAFNKEIDLDSDTIKLALVDDTYVFDQDAHNYFDDVVGDEITGTGYTAGGATVSSVTVAYDGATNTLKIDGGDVSWPSATFDAAGGILYDSTPGSNATRPLIGYIDFDGVQSPSNGTLSVVWDAAGIGTVTVS